MSSNKDSEEKDEPISVDELIGMNLSEDEIEDIEDEAQYSLSAEEWLSQALLKQFPGVPLCESLGAAAPNTPDFWEEFASLLHSKELHWDAVDAWRYAANAAADSESKFRILMAAGEECWSNYHEEKFDEFSAISFFRQAATIKPKDIAPLLWNAYVHANTDNERKSLDIIRSALTLSQGIYLDWSLIDEHPHADVPEPIERFTYLDNSEVHCIVEWAELGDAYLTFGLNQEAIDAYVQAIRFSDSSIDMIEHVALQLSDAGLLPNIKVTYGL